MRGKTGPSKKRAATAKTATKGRAKKASSKKTAAKKTAAKKTVAKKRSAKKTVAKKARTKKASAKKAATKKKTASSKRPAKAATKKGATKPKLKPVGKPKRVGDSSPSSAGKGRKFGLRGAAPWVARHAAKHAEELRKRNAKPARPGSARATLRTPARAEEIKQQIAQLHQQTTQLKKLRKKLDRNFFEVGELLQQIQSDELYQAKGFGTFEAYLDRESDLPRGLASKLIRICQTFQRDTAYDFGIERLIAAMAALDGAVVTAPNSQPSRPSSRSFSSRTLLNKSLRWDD